MASRRKGRVPGPNPVETVDSALQYLERHRPNREIHLLVALVKFPGFDAAQRGILHDALTPPRENIVSVAKWLRMLGLSVVPSALLGAPSTLLSTTAALATQLESMLGLVDERLAANPVVPPLDVDGLAAVVVRESPRLSIRTPNGPEMAALLVFARIEKPSGANVDLRRAREQRWAQALRRAVRTSADTTAP